MTVYMHTCRINGKRQIGITGQHIEKRWSKGDGYRTNPKFQADIQKYGWENFEHIILDENLSIVEAEIKEAEQIEKYDTIRSGYNRSPGGSGFGGCQHTEESKRKIGNAISGANNPNYGGKCCTDEWREKQRRSHTGKKLSEENKRKIGDGVRGKIVHTEEFKKELSERSRKAIMRDDGEKYSSFTEAARANGVSQSALSHAIKRNQKSAGYYWSYTEI